MNSTSVPKSRRKISDSAKHIYITQTFHFVERQFPLNETLREFSHLKIFDSKIIEIPTSISRLSTYFGSRHVWSTYSKWSVNIWSTFSQHLISTYELYKWIGLEISGCSDQTLKFSFCLQAVNAFPIGITTNWSCANNSSLFVNLLQTRNMPKPRLTRWTQN